MQRYSKKPVNKEKKIVKDKKYNSKYSNKNELDMIPIDVSHRTGTPDEIRK